MDCFKSRYVRGNKIQNLIDSLQVDNMLLAIELDVTLKKRALRFAGKAKAARNQMSNCYVNILNAYSNMISIMFFGWPNTPCKMYRFKANSKNRVVSQNAGNLALRVIVLLEQSYIE